MCVSFCGFLFTDPGKWFVNFNLNFSPYMRNLYLPAKLPALICFIFLMVSVQEVFPQGFASLLQLDPLTFDAGVGTSDKSQAKVFKHDGKHWAILALAAHPQGSGTHVFRLDGTTWTHMFRITSRKGRADIKSFGDVVHVFIFQKTTSQLISMQYNARQKTYEPWEARNNIVSFDFNDEVETATIDID